MERENLYIGMKILLSLECKYTKKYFGWNKDMDRFQGTVQKIESITWDRIKCYGTGIRGQLKILVQQKEIQQ